MDREDPKPFDFWRDHSERYLEMALDTGRRGRLENPDGYGRQIRGCGDTVEVYLVVRQDRVASVCVTADGCLHTHACANTVAALAEGGTMADAWQVTPDAVAAYLQTLPPHEMHCAELAVGALRRALSDYHENRRSPWKRAYRKPA